MIGKSGSEVDALRKDLHRITKKQIKVNILEIKRPELDAKLVAQSIAEQLQNRVAFRRAMKRALTRARCAPGAKGVKVQVFRPPRRRRDGAHRGLLGRPCPAANTMRADIDYGFYEARTTFGRIGVRSAGSTRARSCPRELRRHRPHRHEAPRRPPTAASALSAPSAGAAAHRGGGRGDRGGRGGGPEGGPGGPAGGRGGGGGGGRGRGLRAREAAADARAQARQASQAAPRPPRRALARPDQRAVRRVRVEVARGRLADQPPDRGRAYRDDPQDPPRRQGLDQRLSRQAGHQEAGRDSHGAPARARRRAGSPSSSPAA